MNRPVTKLSVWLGLPVLMLVLALAACLLRTEHKIETVSKIEAHIVLDIHQIKDEASQVESDVRGAAKTDAPAEKPKPSSMVRSANANRAVASRSFLSWLDPAGSAYAAEGGKPPVQRTEEEQKAIDTRKERAKKVDEGLTKGYVGENDQGYLEVLVPKSDNADQQKLRQAWDDLAKDENKDRKTIYLAILKRKGGQPADLKLMERVFAGTIRNKLKKDQMFQAPREKDQFDEFKQSDLGKQYPDAKPGQWLKKLKGDKD